MPAIIIALIDDDLSVRNAVGRLIRSFGYEVRSYASAEEFLARPENLAADCVITDVQMPGMNGLDLQLALKQKRADLPVIVMTAFPQDSIRAQALARGAVRYLEKPFDDEQLEAGLVSAVGRATL